MCILYSENDKLRVMNSLKIIELVACMNTEHYVNWAVRTTCGHSSTIQHNISVRMIQKCEVQAVCLQGLLSHPVQDKKDVVK